MSNRKIVNFVPHVVNQLVWFQYSQYVFKMHILYAKLKNVLKSGRQKISSNVLSGKVHYRFKLGTFFLKTGTIFELCKVCFIWDDQHIHRERKYLLQNQNSEFSTLQTIRYRRCYTPEYWQFSYDLCNKILRKLSKS